MTEPLKGDWWGGNSFIRDFSTHTMSTDYEFIANITIPLGTINLYKHKVNFSYVGGVYIKALKATKSGTFLEERFKGVFAITFDKYPIKGYTNSVTVRGVTVSDEESYRKSGIATAMYKHFVKEMGMTIVGDIEQYFGARTLWAKLSDELDVVVDIYDTNKQEIVFKDVVLHQGNYDGDFDERVWSYSKSKYHLRTVLTDIK